MSVVKRSMHDPGIVRGGFRFKKGTDPLEIIIANYKVKYNVDSYDTFHKFFHKVISDSISKKDAAKFTEDGFNICEGSIRISPTECCDVEEFLDVFVKIFHAFIPIIDGGSLSYSFYDYNQTGAIIIIDGNFFRDNDIPTSAIKLEYLTKSDEALNEILQNLDTIKNNYPALLKILSKHGKGPYAGMSDLEFFAAYKE